jgi:hypothetical protein
MVEVEAIVARCGAARTGLRRTARVARRGPDLDGRHASSVASPPQADAREPSLTMVFIDVPARLRHGRHRFGADRNQPSAADLPLPRRMTA